MSTLALSRPAVLTRPNWVKLSFAGILFRKIKKPTISIRLNVHVMKIYMSARMKKDPLNTIKVINAR